MTSPSRLPDLGWLSIVRLGLVQTSLGAIVVLTTSTINRVMVVELALAAVVPGLLVGLHYAVQMLRPRWGHGSDVGGRRTPWIIGGMAVLAAGGLLAAISTAVMETSFTVGLMLAIVAFVMIGVGVGAAGTSLLVLLAKRVAPERRAPAATIVWVMMIIGFIITAATAGHYLDPFSTSRLVVVSGVVSILALSLATLAVWGVEGPAMDAEAAGHEAARAAALPAQPSFMCALREVWAEPDARTFTIFVFVSMLAYSAQDLILEPYAGAVFGFTPGQSTQLAGTQHGGVLAGMIGVAVIASLFKGTWLASLRLWTVAGCLASAVALMSLAVAGQYGPAWPLSTSVFLLGLANGAFAVAAIGSMMARAGEGRAQREGVRMGLWGAAQAIAFGLGGLLGAGLVDIADLIVAEPALAYGAVFAGEGLLFLLAAALAALLGTRTADSAPRVTAVGQNMMASA
ncbi:MAG: BCD family MFS transporter [Hyphomicrobiaceae bacterium]|nr:BCD family MFS transporter [Hyphomicrobiaceae bacterium]